MWREFLMWNKKEQLGVLGLMMLLLTLLLLLWVSPPASKPLPDPELEQWMKEVLTQSDSLRRSDQPDSIVFFVFDPNTASERELLQLGFPAKAVANLVKYREAGGFIGTSQKLASIYGMQAEHLEKIKPFVSISRAEVHRAQAYERQSPAATPKNTVDLNFAEREVLLSYGLSEAVVNDIIHLKDSCYFKRRVEPEAIRKLSYDEWLQWREAFLVRRRSLAVLNDDFCIDINRADTAELVLLKGIGKTFAWRIIHYRTKLGGFSDVEQLLEVDGVSPVVLEDNKGRIWADSSLIRKININQAGLRRMKEHPYMNFYMAKAIVEARKSGPVRLDDMMRLPSFQVADPQRVRQYFSDEL